MKPEQERVKTVLIDTVSLLCKNGLHFNQELKIQAVIGISVDCTDVFLVHINETVAPDGSDGGSSNVSSSAVNADMSLAIVPVTSCKSEIRNSDNAVSNTVQANVARGQVKRPCDVRKTPASEGKRMRAEFTGMVSNSGTVPMKAKQHLNFPTPTKTPTQCQTNMLTEPSLASPGMRGYHGSMPAVRGSRRGKPGRGVHGETSGRQMATRGLKRGISSRGSGRGQHAGFASYSVSGISDPSCQEEFYDQACSKYNYSVPASPQTFAAASDNSGFVPSPNFGFDSAVQPGRNNANSKANVANQAMGYARDNPVSVASDRPSVFNCGLPGSNGGIHVGNFNDINPSVEFGFRTASDSAMGNSPGSSMPPSSNMPSAANIKTESDDDGDVIFVGEDNSRNVPNSSASCETIPATFGNPNDVYSDMPSSGDVLQQITRFVTITANIQGQNVQYEQVQHAVATLPSLNPPSNDLTGKEDALGPDVKSHFADSPAKASAAGPEQFKTDADMFKYGYGDSRAGMPRAGDMSSPHWEQRLPTPKGRGSRMPGPSSVARQRDSAVLSPRLPMSAGSPMRMPVSSLRGDQEGGHMSPVAGAKMRGSGGRGSGIRGSGTRGRGTKKQPTAGSGPSGLPLSQVGLGGGCVEDGTAWSMVARFVCNVPDCGASFSKKFNLLRHQSEKHGRQKATRGVGAKNSGRGDDGDEDDDDDDDEDPDACYDNSGYM